MAWLESHDELLMHPQTLKVAIAMEWNKFETIGRLTAFWHWVVEQVPNGKLLGFDDEGICKSVDLKTQQATRFVNALIEAGWIDSRSSMTVTNIGELMKYRLRGRLRQASRRQLERLGSFSTDEWLSMLEYFDHRCAHCNKRDNNLTMDHLIPLSKGGPHTGENIVPSCQRCNSQKGIKSLLVFTMNRAA